ncbi:MAG: GTPase HflX [Bacteroides sp.]
MIEIANRPAERCVVVALQLGEQSPQQVDEYLDELCFLVATAGALVEKRFVQHSNEINPKTYIGRGKAAEIAAYIEAEAIDFVVFDDELKATQQRNLEQEFKVRVVDRTGLILDIFAAHARTAHSRLQVELAQYEYLLPRLTGMWTHLERQRGGIGMRGPGEREIETDRRVIHNRIAKLKQELVQVDAQFRVQRKNRNALPRVSLIGYTNVGKSTIMNYLAGSELLAENKLFATLDTTVRRIAAKGCKFLLSDTVGFIRKLPTQLIESFKSTLDEVREADLLLHVVDVSHPSFLEQMASVQNILLELGATDKEQIIIFNKIDQYRNPERDPYDLSGESDTLYTLEELQQMWFAKEDTECLFVSAVTGTNMDALRTKLFKRFTTTENIYN